MPDLRSDIIGRIRRLPLKPSDRSSLMPLMEAISNSIHAITERLAEKSVANGRVGITVIRHTKDKHIIGFDIVDNGSGFTKANYEAFLTPDTRVKEQLGGKGVGRLAWLKVFRTIRVDSVFEEDRKRKRRKFVFRLSEKDQVDEVSLMGAEQEDFKTTISFRDFDGIHGAKCPSKPGTIAARVLSHFVPLFVAGNAPKILVIDESSVDVELMFSDSIVNQQTDELEIEIEGEKLALSLWSLKCKKSVRFDVGGTNFAFLTANNRSVLEYSIDDQLGLKTLDGEFVYVGCASGEYLDQHVNAERTGFTLENSEIEAIKRAIAKQARAFLDEYIQGVLAQKVQTTKQIISENPQFLYVEPEVKNFAEGLAPNAVKKEDIFVELSRNRFRRQRTFATVSEQITKSRGVDDQIRGKIDEYKKFLQQEKTGALAEYVVRRKAVLDLFEQLLGFSDPSTASYSKEEAIHQLICPMRIDSSQLAIDDHNLWLLDDRLAFFHFFASDLTLKDYTSLEDASRPDLAFFYDCCVAWREGENSDAVVLVEFKRPMREDYTKGKDPAQQILHYVKRLKTEPSVPDLRGRSIRGITPSTSFHCYVVVDITAELEEKIIGRFRKTPDGQGYFGYTSDPDAFVEILPYGKLLSDARMRNTIFFQKLGITNTGD